MGEKENTSTEKRTARAMLATIALATELPLPTAVTFGTNGITMDLATTTDGLAWAGHLGVEAETYLNKDGNRYLRCAYANWHGWSVGLWAVDRAGEGDHLGEDVATALAAIAETAVES